MASVSPTRTAGLDQVDEQRAEFLAFGEHRRQILLEEQVHRLFERAETDDRRRPAQAAKLRLLTKS